MPTPTRPFADRLQRLQEALGNSDIDAVVLTPGPDVFYLLGASVASHERLSCLIVPAAAEPLLLVPALERLGWAGTSAEDTVDITTWLDGTDPYQLVSDALPAATTLAVADSMPAAHLLYLRDAIQGVELSLAGSAMAGLPGHKSAAQIGALANVGSAIDRVQQRIDEWLRPGRTENDVAADIAAAILDEGHERADFVIVGSGPNGASPHHEASDRVLQPGDVVVIDIGGPSALGPLPGYFSDCTRTYQLAGTPDPEFAEVYEVVRRAQQAGVEAVRPGVPAEEVDAAARAVIVDAGYGASFITRTGHGIGLEVHENPYIVTGNTQALEPGMTFSVEPGIYLPGRFGVRIEDIVAVPDGGETRAVRLNNCARELQIV